MTPTGKGIVLAALDILVETKTLIKRDYNEAKKLIEQIPDEKFSVLDKMKTKCGRQKNAKQA